MQTRPLGNTDLSFTTMGLGTWAIGGGDWIAGWGPQDDADSIATINAAIDAGINWIDTAAVYGIGHSEAVVGQAIAGRRDEVLVASKCGRDAQPDRIVGRLDHAAITAEVDSSLQRLGIDHIDLYQLHWPQPDEMIEEAWGAMLAAKQAGKVRHIGVCNCSIEQMQRLQAIHPIASLQPPYSMLQRSIEAEILPFCAEHQIGIIGYSPMAKGLLTGRWSAARLAQLDPSDHRTRDPNFKEPRFAIHMQLVEGLRQIAAECECSPAHVAIAWTLRHPAFTSAIVGARQVEQIQDTAKAGSIELSSEQIERLEQFLKDHAQALAALES